MLSIINLQIFTDVVVYGFDWCNVSIFNLTIILLLHSRGHNTHFYISFNQPNCVLFCFCFPSLLFSLLLKFTFRVWSVAKEIEWRFIPFIQIKYFLLLSLIIFFSHDSFCRCQLSFFYFKALFVRKERKIKALSTT